MKNTNTDRSVSNLDEFALINTLRELRTHIPDSPWLNPITSIAFDLSRRLEAEEISFQDLKDLSVRLMDRACVTRAQRLRERVGFQNSESTYREFTGFIDKCFDQAGTGDDGLAAAARRFSRATAGIVFTAHPTFGASRALYRHMVDMAVSGEAPNGQANIGIRHRPDNNIDLNYEHECAQECISNLRDAYEDLQNRYFSAAAARYGQAAYKSKANFATIASWVGYDLDGRTDITWIDSFRLRLQEKKAALQDIRKRFLLIKHQLDEAGEAQRLTRQLIGKLDLAIAAVSKQSDSLRNINRGGLAAAANVITEQDGYNLNSVAPITELLNELIDEASTTQMKRKIAALRGLIEATGLGTSHIHVRINAAQLSNALRAYVHEPWTTDMTERSAMSRLVDLIAQVKPETVNFKTLDTETATAIRQFAFIAQMKKHVDAETPIRFLIAECESPATVLIAILFAKLFGVSKTADISPLFETPDALERGSRLIERLLEQQAYRDYVRGRGRLCIQTGFSDAGRFIGQMAATLSIERLNLTMADVIKKAGIEGVETLIFSTHGESMGRGCHPGGLHKRLRYLLPHEVRRRYKSYNLPIKHETSFQGGDGFLIFDNREMTTKALSSIIQDAALVEDVTDPFYEDENQQLDLLLRLRGYQQDLFAHSGYRALLGSFGPNLLFRTGSRAVKRQSGASAVGDRGNPARMRAIPNNAILQQFGYIANVVSGLGQATWIDRDSFIAVAKNSPRLRTMLEMVALGKQLSSLNAMGANAYVFDAGFWASRASWGREAHLESAFRTLSRFLLTDPRASTINGLMHHLRLDAIDLHAILEVLGIEAGKIPDDTRLELDLLQAIRLALIMHVFIIAARLPRISARNDITYGRLLEMSLSLEVPEVVNFMRENFPRHAQDVDDQAFSEKASYTPQGIAEYSRLEEELLSPMEETYEFIREIGTGISHHFGAFG